MKTNALVIIGAVMGMGVGIVKGADCPPPGDPVGPRAGEGQVKASATPSPSATPVSRSAR